MRTIISRVAPLLVMTAGLLTKPVLAAESATVTVGMGASIPPYVFQKTRDGVLIELVEAVFALEGIEPRPKPIYGEGQFAQLKSGWVDALITSNHFQLEEYLGLDLYRSAPLLPYQNGVVVLADADFEIERLEDLANLRILAFHNARRVLGPGFAEVVADHPGYREVSDQTAQVTALYRELTDAVIADRRIFAWFQSHVRKRHGLYREVRFMPLFAPSEWTLFFRSQALRDRFSRGLAELRRSGRYQALVDQAFDNQEVP